MTNITEAEALERAVEAVGSRAEIGRRLGISQAAVQQWQRVPPLRVLEVERISGVSRSLLRPDLYPPDPAEAQSVAG